jgi:hypothetical protein
MLDRREQILQRLEYIFTTIPAVTKTARNREDVSGKSRPAILLHDAAEDVVDLGERPATATKDFVTMSPQIMVLLGAPAGDVGTQIAAFRASIIPAVLLDTQLRSLCAAQLPHGGGGRVRYMGCLLDTTTGETTEARLELKFELTYLMDPAELSAS